MRQLKCWSVAAVLFVAPAVLAQSGSMPRIGWVLSGTLENSGHLIEAIRSGLAAESLVISEDAFTFSNRAQIVGRTAEQGMVDISAFREFVLAGGVMSYGANYGAASRLVARRRGDPMKVYSESLAWPLHVSPRADRRCAEHAGDFMLAALVPEQKSPT